MACAALVSQRRWMLSGTPISTKISELRGQLLALQLGHIAKSDVTFRSLFEAPFGGNYSELNKCPLTGEERFFLLDENRCRRTGFGERFPLASVAAMRLLLPNLLLRHTHDMTVAGEQVLSLPPKTASVVRVQLSVDERRVYLRAEREIQARWREMLAMGPDVVAKSYFLATSLLTPLRRLCSGGDIRDKELVARKLPSHGFVAEWKMRMAASPTFAAPSAAALGHLPGNDPAGAACAVCCMEPEGGVRTRCCSAWACRECLLSRAEEDGVCPNVICGRKLERGEVPPPPPPAKGGDGLWADSMPDQGPAPAAAAPAAAEDADGEAAPDAPMLKLDSKLKALLAELKASREADPTCKTLVFSRYADMR